MRVELAGVRRTRESFVFEFAGHSVTAWPGETVAAALVAEGIWNLRRTRQGEPRGMFCGMGVCGECVVRIDGVARRACQELAAPGMKVNSAESVREEIANARIRQALSPDVLVVGAGPAGLAAAQTAALAGLNVLVVDERKSAGGQYFKQPGTAFRVDVERIDQQFREGRALAAAAQEAGAVLLPEAVVWGAFAADESLRIEAVTPRRKLTIHPKRLVLACGAYERGVPFPGWTLPGVITTGAAQTLLRASQVTPGRRVLIAGNGPLNLQVARELAEVGVEVVALAETAKAPGLHAIGSALQMALSAPGLVRDGLSHLRALRRRGVPVCYQHALVRVEGAAPALSATIAQIDTGGHPVPGTEQTFEVEAVCVGYGFLPQSELARALGCRHTYDSERGSLVVERDMAGRTSVPEVFVVGDAGGLGGARIALSQGTLAGIAVARDLWRAVSGPSLRAETQARRMLTKHRRFQKALWTLYRAPLLIGQLATPDTHLCRCESITRATLETVAADVETLGAVKRLTRAGMGHCQGRYCSPIIAAQTIEDVCEHDFLAPRPPARPTPITSLAIHPFIQERRLP